MLNDNIKTLITTTITLYNFEKLTQNIIEEGFLKLKEAIRLIKEQQEATPIEKITTPVTLEELESKFPIEPEYPELQLREDYNLEVNLKADLLTLDVAEGTIIKTKGYYAVNDGGQAVYEIMSYDNWWDQLPIELKMCMYSFNRLGGAELQKNKVDNYGNHKLNNGMVAKILPNLDEYVRVEQWGLFENRDDNTRAMIHLLANNHTNSKILFGKNANYVMHYTRYNQYHDINPSSGNTGNEYAALLHSRVSSKPCIGDALNVELCGNNCHLYVPDNEFCTSDGLNDFSTIEMGGNIDGLKIHGFNFDNNGLNQFGYNNSSGEYVSMKTTNHTISYFSIEVNLGYTGKVRSSLGEVIPDDFTVEKLLNYRGNSKKTAFNNVEIYGNTFNDNGVAHAASDCGGDFILIINPLESKNVSIHNNKMYNWGRWCFAVDLGGNGERFFDYSFKNNICIQDSNNCIGIYNTTTNTIVGRTETHRGLGWIDFEARKCFTNLDVSENYVYGANGWAFNGNGKISENIKIERNHIERPSYNSWRSIYSYAFTFYSVYTKDLAVKHNTVIGGSVGFGKLFYNTIIENNKFISVGTFGIVNPFKNVLIKDNVGEGTRDQLFSLNVDSLTWVNDENSEFYVPEEDRVTTVTFENNGEGGICGNIINIDNNSYKNNITLIFKNNIFRKFNVNCFGIKDYQFTPDQLVEGVVWSARGCKTSYPVVSLPVDNPVPGGLYYKEGDLVTSTLNNITRLYSPKYFATDFPQLKNDNDSTKKDVYCTKEGVFPLNGAFLMCDTDTPFGTNAKKSVGNYVYTLDNLYYVTVAGTLGDIEPTHTEGIVTNGTCELLWVAPIARYEMRNE